MKVIHYKLTAEQLEGKRTGKPKLAPSRPPASRLLKLGRWPKWAMAIAILSSRADSGVGDTFARLVLLFGDGQFGQWHRATFGNECACDKTQADWNAQFGYPEGRFKRLFLRLSAVAKTVTVLLQS